MTTIFRDRGYPRYLVRQTVQAVPFSVRQQKLYPNNASSVKYDTFLVTTYTHDLDTRRLKAILKPTQAEVTHVPRPCLSLTKPKNFRNILVRAKIRQSTDPPVSDKAITIPVTPILDGNSAGCATHGCKCCRAMSRKVRVHSSSSHKSFYTPKHTNCNTMGVIYLLECSKCTSKNQYVGQTKRTLAQRLAGHRAASRIKHNLPIYKHFNTHTDHNFERDVRLTILEKPPIHSLNSRESYWISTLDTVHPKGLNSRYE